ncbi:PEBP-like protein [Agrocybe pediades]|nr:PEBP-like protein [Agrocybe pediades]
MQFLHAVYLQFACVLLTCSARREISLAEVMHKFQEHKIPEDLGIIFQPRVQLQVIYQQPNKTCINVTPGEQLQMSETAIAPTYRMVGDAGTDGPFIILMVDPDAPTLQNRSFASIRHFLGGNYSLSPSYTKDSRHHQRVLINGTEPISSYWAIRPIGLQHLIDSSLEPGPLLRLLLHHRYIFLIYEQPPDFDGQTLVTPTYMRFFFNLSSFPSTTGLGQPIGGNFMIVGPDMSSPIWINPH